MPSRAMDAIAKKLPDAVGQLFTGNNDKPPSDEYEMVEKEEAYDTDAEAQPDDEEAATSPTGTAAPPPTKKQRKGDELPTRTSQSQRDLLRRPPQRK